MLGRRTIIDYGTGYNMAQGSIGTEVPSASEDRGSVKDVLGPDTEAGQALLVAGIGFGVLMLTAGAGERSIVGKAGAALTAVAAVGSAVVVFNYLARVWVARHPNAPLAMGVHFDA